MDSKHEGKEEYSEEGESKRVINFDWMPAGCSPLAGMRVFF